MTADFLLTFSCYMTFTFYPELPADVGEPAALLGGETPHHSGRTEYLVVRDGEQTRAFEIPYEYHCGPFKEAAVEGDLLLVGHEAYFYLYELSAHQSLLVLELNGYFSHFYIHGDHFYVADAQGLHCVDRKGTVLWTNHHLGLDGVVVERFTDQHLYGSGEWDPPGDWKGFVLELATGQNVVGTIG